MSFYYFVLIIYYVIYNCISCDLNVGFITILSGGNIQSGIQIQAAENIAIWEINNNNNILPNCTLRSTIIDSQSKTSNVVRGGLQLAGYNECNDDGNTTVNDLIDKITVPFVMGAQFSSLSSYLNPVLNTFNILQIAASATSVSLSGLRTFHRVVPADTLQAQGLLQLCLHFNWRSIGVLYVNDAYGVYLHSVISTRASQLDNFSVIGASYDSESLISIDRAIDGLQKAGVFVIILIVHDSEFSAVIQSLKDHDMWRYPFYYLGSDSWMDGTLDIVQENGDGFIGTLGTCPWAPNAPDSAKDSYSLYAGGDYEEIYNQTVEKMGYFMESWNTIQQENPQLLYNMTEPAKYSSYGYDLVYLFAYALTEYHELYGIPDNINDYDVTKIRQILVETSFLGLTGNVSLNDFGDRIYGFFGLCLITKPEEGIQGNVKTVGYVIQTEEQPPKYVFHIDDSALTFPSWFDGRKPRTFPQTIFEVGEISESIIYASIALCCLLSTIAFVFAILLYIWRDRSIIKAASWKLMMLMCFGCIIGYITAVVYGIDERFIPEMSKKEWRTLCNVRPAVMQLALILGFGPLFAKTYRISKIFNMTKLQEQVIPDSYLFIAIFALLGLDTILYIFYLGFSGQKRDYTVGDLLEETEDPLEIEKYKWGTCVYVNPKTGEPLFFSLGVLVVGMFAYGLYLATTVVSVRLRKFNEALEIVVSVILSSCLMAIVAPLVVFVNVRSQSAANLRFGCMAAMCFIAFSAPLFLIVVPKFYVILSGKEKEFEKKDVKNLQDMRSELQKSLKAELKKFEQKLFESVQRPSVVDSVQTSTKSHHKQLGSLVGASNIVNATNKLMITGKFTENFDAITEEPELESHNNIQMEMQDVLSQTKSSTIKTSTLNSTINSNTISPQNYKKNGPGNSSSTQDTISNYDADNTLEINNDNSNNIRNKRGTSLVGLSGLDDDNKSPKSDDTNNTDNNDINYDDDEHP